MTSKVKFIEDGNTVSIVDIPDGLIKDTLNPGVYKPVNTVGGFYLERIQQTFESVHLFGFESRRREQKVIKRYTDLTSSMGVMFTGLKGTGKSQTVKNIASHFISTGYPCIIIDKGIEPDILTALTTKLDKCIFIFDEFEKNFKLDSSKDSNRMTQTDLLTIFDGIYSNGDFLFLLTANSEVNIMDMYFDRPERIRYVFRYNKLTQDEISEYLKANDINDDIVPLLERITLNFDLLKNIVQELKFGESIDVIIKDLGIEKEYDAYFSKGHIEYDGTIKEIDIGLTKVTKIDLDDMDWYMNIKSDNINPYVGNTFEYSLVDNVLTVTGLTIAKIDDVDREVTVKYEGFLQERKQLN